MENDVTMLSKKLEELADTCTEVAHKINIIDKQDQNVHESFKRRKTDKGNDIEVVKSFFQQSS